MMFSALITFFFDLLGTPPPGVSGSKPAIRRLRHGGAAGQALAFRRLARGVGRILHVTLETFVMEHARRAECEDGQACLAGEPPGSNWEWE